MSVLVCEMSDSDNQDACNEADSTYEGWTVICVKKNGKPIVCDTCTGKSTDDSEFVGSHAGDKYGGRLAWRKYKNDFALKVRTVTHPRCLACAATWQQSSPFGEYIRITAISIHVHMWLCPACANAHYCMRML